MVLDYPTKKQDGQPADTVEEKQEQETEQEEQESDVYKSTAYVKRVIDGDTIILTDLEGYEGEERVRLLLIDTPEICHEHDDESCVSEPYGEEAKWFLANLIEGKKVTVERDVSERDRYGRLLFYVYLESGEMVQKLLLAEGLARVAVFPPDTKYELEFISIQNDAKSKNKGIW